ncbi:hypothetical protein BC940DRAFT_298265 [Gongronella butleri]|nr:hypothetical protein BC940DRAFT_298265 [Gongronella butleri]
MALAALVAEQWPFFVSSALAPTFSLVLRRHTTWYTEQRRETNTLLDLLHVERDVEVLQHEERVAEQQRAQEEASAMLDQLAIAPARVFYQDQGKTATMMMQQQANIIDFPMEEPAAPPVSPTTTPATGFIDLAYRPRQRQPKQQRPPSAQVISAEKQYKIWESIYVNRLSYALASREVKVSRSTCYKYAKQFDNNPPMDAIKLFNPKIHARILQQQKK